MSQNLDQENIDKIIAWIDSIISQMDELIFSTTANHENNEQLFALNAHREALSKCQEYLKKNPQVACQIYDKISSSLNVKNLIQSTIDCTEDKINAEKRAVYLNDTAQMILFYCAIGIFITSCLLASSFSALIWGPLMLGGIIGIFAMTLGSTENPEPVHLLGNSTVERNWFQSIFYDTENDNLFGVNKLSFTPSKTCIGV